MDKNLLLTDDAFAPATPDSLEHLPSHHCGQDAEESPPVVADAKSQMMREINLDLEAHPLDRNPAVLARAVSHIEFLDRQLAGAIKGHAMYEHVRTLNPSQFTDIWVLNLRGGGAFDDLVLADMDKRKGDRA